MAAKKSPPRPGKSSPEGEKSGGGNTIPVQSDWLLPPVGPDSAAEAVARPMTQVPPLPPPPVIKVGAKRKPPPLPRHDGKDGPKK